MASIGLARGAETPRGKTKENSPQRVTSNHKKNLEGERAGGPLPAISFLLKGLGDLKTVETVDKLDKVPLREDHPDWCIKISAELKDPLRGQVIALLRQYTNIFTWTTQGMPGVDLKVMTHRLGIRPCFQPIKQKKQSFSSERARVIKVEMEKLMEVQYIQEVDYPHWLENVVLVPKRKGKWRLCIDVTDLNKACSKDSYPFPRIDVLINGTARCLLMSFLGAF